MKKGKRNAKSNKLIKTKQKRKIGIKNVRKKRWTTENNEGRKEEEKK